MNKKLIQLNLNTKNSDINYGEDILMTYGIKTGNFYLKNKQTILKYIAYYKKIYYNFGVKLNKDELWLIVILSKNFTELYDLLETLLPEDKRDKFIRKVINMSKDTFILSEWEKEKMDALKELGRLEDAEEEGLKRGMEKGIEQGISQSKIEIAKNLLENNISIEMISKCTGLTIDEINNLKN